MEAQFNTISIPCLHTLSRQTQYLEQTQEARLTDDMPDIGRVLGSWGQVVIRSKQWNSGSVVVSGGVLVWTLYAPEEEGLPQVVESWLPLQTKLDIPETQRDGSICVLPVLRSVDARSLSARKLMVRAAVAFCVEAAVPENVEISMPDKLPEDIRVLKNTYPMWIPKEAGEKAFQIEEVLSLPASAAGISKLVRYTLTPELLEMKVVTDKLVIRGVANLSVLYLDANGQLQKWEMELPFSQYADLDRDYDSQADARIWLALTGLELEQGEEENLNLRAGITAQYVLGEQTMVELAEDAYSPIRQITPYISRVMLPVVLDDRKMNIEPETVVPQDGLQPVDVSFYSDIPKLHRNGDQITADMSGYFQTLGYDQNGQLQSGQYRWEESCQMDADPDADVDMWISRIGKTQQSIGGNGSVSADMMLHVQTGAARGIPVMTDMTVGDIIPPDPNRPSLILRRAGEDSLWQIAKQTGSTVEAIQKANGLEDQPAADQMLLIPVS